MYNAANSGIVWHSGLTDGSGTWKYSDWTVIEVDTSALSGLNGHAFQVSVSAYDCGWGGHGGYAYVDSFQPTVPQANPGVDSSIIHANDIVVPEPATGLLLLGGLVLCGRRQRSIAA